MFGATCMLLCGFLALHFRAADRGCPSAPGLPCALSTGEGNGREQNSGVWCRENACSCVFQEDEMVLPDRIELSTSPLPMECSTTELRQQCWDKNRPPQGPNQAGRYLPQASPLCKLARTAKTRKSERYRGYHGCFGPKRPTFSRFWFRLPGQLASWPPGRIRPILDFARSGPWRPLELPQSLRMLSRTAVWDP